MVPNQRGCCIHAFGCIRYREHLLQYISISIPVNIWQTQAAISSCIMALLDHPDILRRAQEEVDSVLTFGDLPTFEEEPRLQFIMAICLETMRWRDVAPIGMIMLLTRHYCLT